jgi:DDE_Tnp_1-associated
MHGLVLCWELPARHELTNRAMTLIDALEDLSEFRRAQGTRHRLSHVIVCLLLSLLSGGASWRDHGEFVQRHKIALLKYLQPYKGRLPSYSTMRRIGIKLNFNALSDAFLTWARSRVQIEDGEWLSMDGKSMRGTVSDAKNAEQNFTAMVTLYLQKRGLVVDSRAYQNKKESEAHVVEAMLTDADLKGAGVTLDALHCRKKHAL